MFQTHIHDQLKQLSHDLIEEYVKCRQQSPLLPRVFNSNNAAIKMSVQPKEYWSLCRSCKGLVHTKQFLDLEFFLS